MQKLIKKLREFAKERDWDQFHSPKNLSMALSVEVAEVVEHFQWLTEEQSKNLSPDKLKKIKEEIGDVFIYLVRLADKLDIDLFEAADEKIEKNKLKYPAETVRGKSFKYSEYKND
ncbi:MAG: nucleotide pyrophosphohydrolase [bacterium]